MDCASCGQANRSAARFCSRCGSPLAPRCPECGAEHERDARFCDTCGATLARTADPSGAAATTDSDTRRVVTVVFADLIGSTTLHERIDAESARRVMDRYYATLRAVIEDHDGTVIKLLGDGVLAGFGVQTAHEDDALRAVRAAVAMHVAMHELTADLGDLAGELGLRIAINTGEVVVGAHDDDVVGDPVNVAARLQNEADAGDVLIGDATRRLVADVVTLEPAGEFALKGRAGTVAAHRVVSLERPATGPTTTFVGRDDELRRVLASYTTATIDREARLVIMVGSPGLGKSRLMDEVSRRLIGEASILTARCDVSGGPTFTPIADAIRAFVSAESEDPSRDPVRAGFEALIGEDEGERDRIINGAVGLCAGEPGPPEETFWVVRRVLAALGRRGPVVLAIDDLHWAEPLLLDLVEHLVEWSTDVPLLVLGAARPELRDTRSSLTTAGGVADVVLALDGLDAGAATRLAADAIGAAELPAAVAGRVLAASEGNPLFLGALVRMLVEDGALEWDGDRWVATVELDELQMPPTIHALLAARIDRLDSVVRLVLERASVIGRQFSREAVAYLLPSELHAELDATLESLRRSELIEPDDTWFLGEPALRFHHALIRDAAYRRLLKDARADLHASFAEWLEQRVGAGSEQDETIGLHFEQAYRHLDELGPLDDRARSLGVRAAERLGAEGRRALARDDLTVAAGLLGRAVAVLQPADPQRADLALDWCEALLAAGDVSYAPNAIAELDRWADASERLQAWRISFIGHLAVLTDPQRLRETADEVAAAAATLAALDDAAGEAKAHSVRALALARLGEVGACETALDQALVAARRADDRRRSNAVLAGAPVAALWGPSPVTRASGRCLDVVRVLRITAAAPAVEAVAMRCQAVLEALRGRGDAARRMIASSRRTVEELGLTIRILEADMAAGLIELVNGEPAAAEALLRKTYAGFRDRGLGVDAAQAGALLGRSLLALGRVSQAEAISHECEELAGHDLKAAIAWRGVRAESLARRGQYTAAIDFARDAVAIAAGTDALLDHADARVALAVALRVAGKHTEAEAELAAAFDLWSAKGATALLAGDAEHEQPVETVVPVSDEPDQDLDHAIAGLEQGAERAAFATLATRSIEDFVAAMHARDMDAVEALVAPNFVGVDQRPVLHDLSDREKHLGILRLTHELASVEFGGEALATRGENLVLLLVQFSSTDPSFGVTEIEYLQVVEVDDTGRMVGVVTLDVDDLDAAYAELDRRHDRSTNIAFAALQESERLWREGDWDGVVALYDHDDFELEDRRSLMHMRLRGEGFIENLRFLFDTGHFVSEFMDSRGDCLALLQAEYVSNNDDSFASAHLTLAETNEAGLLIAMVVFDVADVEAANAELDARFAGQQSLSQIGENSAVRVLAQVGDAMEARDVDKAARLLSPEFRAISHRSLFQHDSDRETHLVFLRVIMEVESFTSATTVLATRGDRLALTRLMFRGEITFGGKGEIEWLQVTEVDERGLCMLMVSFDPDDLDAAYAELDQRFATLGDEAESSGDVLLDDQRARLVPNGPSLALAAIAEGLGRGDRDAIRSHLSSTLVIDDRREGRWTGGVFDALVGASLSHWPASQLSDRFTVGLVRTDDGDAIWAMETDESGRIAHIMIFPPDAWLVASLALLERIPTELLDRDCGPLVPTLGYLEGWHAHDLDAIRRTLADDFLGIDHRLLGPGAASTAAERVAAVGSLFAVAPDAHVSTVVMVDIQPTSALGVVRLAGSMPDGGSFEFLIASFSTIEHGLIARMELYDYEDLARGEVGLDVTRPTGRTPSTNVIRVLEQLSEAYHSGDWQRFEALSSPAIIMDDRRGLNRVRGDFSMWIESTKLLAEANATEVDAHLSVLGDGLVLDRILWTSAGESARFEVDALRVCQLDDHGRLAAVVIFDPADRLAANDELWRRYLLTDEGRRMPAVIDENRRAFGRHDLDAVRATLRDDFILDDHRRTGIGAVGVDAYLESIAALLDETEGLIGETVSRVAISEHGTLSVGRNVGTVKQGGDFEHLFARIFMTDGQLLTRVELFELDDMEVAKARFQSLVDGTEHASATSVTLPSNAATRASDRTFLAFAAEDWSALDAQPGPQFIYRDHRNGVHTDFDAAQWIESMRLMVASNARPQRRLLSVLGEQVMLEWVQWTGRSGDPEAEWAEFEVELLRVVEVDGDGLLVSVSVYDGDDRRAANDELWRLYEQSDDGRRLSGLTFENRRAFNDHDLEAMRATLRDNFVWDDHRRTGSGELGVDAYLESVAALFASTSALVSETLYFTAISQWGTISVASMFGTAIDGGEFENVLVRLSMTDGQLLTRIEIFEVDDLELARSRFAELCPIAPSGLNNRATQTVDRWDAALLAKDRAALHSLLAPEFTFEDRGRLIRVVGRQAEFEMSNELIMSQSVQLERHVVSALGDCLDLERKTWSGESMGAEFVIDRLTVHEVDRQGQLIAVITFDVDDRVAADDELWSRFDASGEGSFRAPVREQARRAFNRHDFPALRAALHENFVFEDCRKTSIGFLNADEYVESVAALGEESQSFSNETVYMVTQEPWGGVDVARIAGTTKEGAPFENLFVRCIAIRDLKIVVIAIFEPEEVERATARLEELRPQAQSIAGFDDLEAFRSMLAEDCVLVDHRLLAAEPMGRDEYVAYFAALLEQTSDLNYERFELLAEVPEGMVERARLTGHTTDGVEFETLFLRVTMLRDGLVVAMEIFPPEDRDAAFSRFEELQTSRAHIPPTSATRTMDRWRDALHVADRAALDALVADPFVFDDRRALTRVLGDRQTFGRSTEAIIDSRVRLERAVLSTLGDRLALEHTRWTGSAAGGEFDGEMLSVHEVDGADRLCAVVSFDVDDRQAANDELWSRFRMSDEARILPLLVFDVVHAVNHRDVAGFRATLADDFEVVDHRPLALQRMDGDEYSEFFASLVSETTDSVYETLHILRMSPLGAVDIARMPGHTRDGVAFEIVWAHVAVVRDGRLATIEMFSPEDADLAVARFDELCSIAAVDQPRNKATDALERAQGLYQARDWKALEGLASPAFLFSDRRQLAHVTSDRDGWIHSSKLMASASAEENRTILRVLGDRLALYQSLWTAEVEAAPYVVESLGLCEVDEEGRFVELLHFDLEQRREAENELAERFQRMVDGEFPNNAATRAMDRWIAALEARDRDAMIASVAPSFVYDDRRSLTGVALDRAEWISTQDISIATNLSLRSTTLSTLGDRLAMAHERWRGESEGAVFDGENLTIREVDTEGRITAIVTFDLSDRQAANDELARRFRRSEEGRLLPSVLFDAVHASNHRDGAAFRATLAEAFALYDHQPLGVGSTDADGYAEFFDALVSETSDSAFEVMHVLRGNSMGAVALARMPGHTREGAAFERLWIQVTVVREQRLAEIHWFAPEDADLAVARFEELTGDHEQ